MEQIELTLERTMPIWWAFAWRAFLISMLAGLVLGAIVGVAGSPQLGGAVGSLLGLFAAIPVSIWAMKSALSKTYGIYSVVLIKR